MSAPRGYALLVVLLAIAVATGVLLRALAVRPAAESRPSMVAAWHDAHAVLDRCVRARALTEETAVTEPGPVFVDGGACDVTTRQVGALTVVTVRVASPAGVSIACSVARDPSSGATLVHHP